MNYRTRLKQLLIVTFFMWVLAAAIVGTLTYGQINLVLWSIMLAALLLAAGFSLLTLNQSQLEVSESNKNHSRTKRQVQEQQLKLDRYEYDAKKSGELRRIVLNSTQEKDHSLRNMATALDHAMDEILTLVDEESPSAELNSHIQTRAEGMKRYAMDLQSLAQLELKSELPTHQELDFLPELTRLIEGWTAYGRSRKVKIKLDNPEEQMPLYSDMNWIENILSRVVQALIRMNEQTVLHVHMIGYMDAELNDALRIEFAIDGRTLSEEQLKHVLTEYVSIVEEGQEVGPGLSFVVARRMSQLLNGYLDVNNTDSGMNVLVVLPRNPTMAEDSEDVAVI